MRKIALAISILALVVSVAVFVDVSHSTRPRDELLFRTYDDPDTYRAGDFYPPARWCGDNTNRLNGATGEWTQGPFDDCCKYVITRIAYDGETRRIDGGTSSCYAVYGTRHQEGAERP
jgi:hypothetical protein